MKKEVILFAAISEDWDRSSRKMSYIFSAASHTPLNKDFNFVTYDVESHKGVDASIKYKVRNVPTILIMEEGKEIGRIKGFRNEEQLVNELNKWK